MIDFPTMKQFNLFDTKKQRPVKRGKQHERGPLRPSDEKFMDNQNFLIGEFRPITENMYSNEPGGEWLGSEFNKSIDRKPFSV